MMKFGLVDAKSLSGRSERSDFDPTLVQNLAESIIELGGLIQPIVVKLTAITEDGELYEVAGNDEDELLYQAAKLAYEKNPQKAGLVNAMIVTEVEAALKQKLLLQKNQNVPQNPDLERMKQLKAEMLEIASKYGI